MKVRALAKKAFLLPNRTASPFFYANSAMGGLGLPSVENEMDAHRVTQVVKLLNSTCPTVKPAAWTQAGETMRKRLLTEDQDDAAVVHFLNQPPLIGEGGRGDLRSLWSLAHSSIKRCKCGLMLEGSEVLLTCNEKPVREKKTIHSTLMDGFK